MTIPEIKPPDELFIRRVCACRKCTIPCETMPGNLIPSDLPKIAAYLGNTIPEMEPLLLASPGVVVKTDDTIHRFGTLIPATKPDGSCIFLTEDKRCAIHKVAPFGCAYFDMHMNDEQAKPQARYSAATVGAHWLWDRGNPYVIMRQRLYFEGRRALDPIVSRANLIMKSIKELGLAETLK